VVPGDGTKVWGEVHINKGRVGEERGGKEMDGCPLTDAVWFMSSTLVAVTKLPFSWVEMQCPCHFGTGRSW
jgi:hypothetical protein